jgi:hypothetical protein
MVYWFLLLCNKVQQNSELKQYFLLAHSYVGLKAGQAQPGSIAQCLRAKQFAKVKKDCV